MEIKIDSKEVRKVLSAYSYNSTFDHCGSITKVELYQNEDKFRVVIETHRPGYLIGRGGTTINEIKRWIARRLSTNEENLTIDIKECELFHNLYS